MSILSNRALGVAFAASWLAACAVDDRKVEDGSANPPAFVTSFPPSGSAGSGSVGTSTTAVEPELVGAASGSGSSEAEPTNTGALGTGTGNAMQMGSAQMSMTEMGTAAQSAADAGTGPANVTPPPRPAQPGCDSNLLGNPNFESGVAPWIQEYTGTDPIVSPISLSMQNGGTSRAGGNSLAWFGGVANDTERLTQPIHVPSNVVALDFSLYGKFNTSVDNTVVDDHMRVVLLRGATELQQLEAWTNLDTRKSTEWMQYSVRIDATPYAGQDLALRLECVMGVRADSNFFIDDVSLSAECTP